MKDTQEPEQPKKRTVRLSERGQIIREPEQTATNLPEVDLERLRELYAKAPGPWPDPDTDEDMEISDVDMESARRLIYALHKDFPAILQQITTLTQDKVELEGKLEAQKISTEFASNEEVRRLKELYQKRNDSDANRRLYEMDLRNKAAGLLQHNTHLTAQLAEAKARERVLREFAIHQFATRELFENLDAEPSKTWTEYIAEAEKKVEQVLPSPTVVPDAENKETEYQARLNRLGRRGA